MASLDDELRARTMPIRPGTDTLVTAGSTGLRCHACAHRCLIAPDRAGACGVRWNGGGVLHVPFGYVARRHVRPVETNTIYHVLPGAKALTFGMFGCDLRCGYCHNWKLSQALRDGLSDSTVEVSAEALAEQAVQAGARVLAAAYNEPMISAEWAFAVFAAARRRGLVTALVSDGHSTRQALRFMRPVTDVFRVDLKAASEAAYRRLGGRLAPVLDTIGEAVRLGFWVEVVTLVVPDFNDSRADVVTLADVIRAVSPAIPWHLNAFQPRYKMTARPAMDPAVLLSAAGTALSRGLDFVYVGNTALTGFEATRCPRCHETLVERRNYQTVRCAWQGPRCPTCDAEIPGLWRRPPLSEVSAS